VGVILIKDADGVHQAPLSPSTLVGRHFLTCKPIVDPTIHLYWLEIRWSSKGWLWRTLAGAGRTRGAGTLVDELWRTLPHSGARGGRIVWQDRVSVELVDPSPPGLCGRELKSGSWMSEDQLTRLVEDRGEGYFSLGTGLPVTDGDTIESSAGPVQLYLPTVPMDTEKSRFSVLNSGLHIDLCLGTLAATFTVSDVEAEVRGECVRVLAAYAIRRAAYVEEARTWLTRPDAHALWRALGGNTSSPEARVAWERGKVRLQLNQQGVADTSELFAVADRRGARMCRLSIPFGQVSVHGADGAKFDLSSVGL